MEQTNRLLRIALMLEYLNLNWNLAGVVILALAQIHSTSSAPRFLGNSLHIGKE
jgi:hypothetical protein